MYADEALSDTQQQLDKISQIVAEITQKLEKKQKNQGVVQAELIQLEREIGKLHRQVTSYKEQISTSQRQLQVLDNQSDQLNQQIKQQNINFKQQIRLAYSSGSQSKWKVLLSQNSLQHVGRNAVIYDFIHQARAQQITAMKNLSRELNDNRDATREQQQTLQNLLNNQSKLQSSLVKVRDEKQNIQRQLSKDIENQSSRLKQQQAKQKQLKKLLKKLTIKHSKGKFAQQKGKLNWPVKGNLKHRYGEWRQSSAGIKWDGALIRAKKGAGVKAIYPGTVVFSDWFDHYGWMIIVDHGDGYMSLYAHMEGLYKEVDEVVTKGELIAVAGDSGDIDESGLYFEIRRQGAPVDPASWCVHPKMTYSP